MATWYCSQCARPVGSTITALAGRMGWCAHGADRAKLVPLVESAERAHELIDARLDRQALRRALIKANTAEGRASLTNREARVLAEHRQPAADGSA